MPWGNTSAIGSISIDSNNYTVDGVRYVTAKDLPSKTSVVDFAYSYQEEYNNLLKENKVLRDKIRELEKELSNKVYEKIFD